MTKKKTAPVDKPLIKSTNQFSVVGVGASAGGLDAFKRLLKAIPENSGIAYVLVQHLDPTHESLLTEILQKVTSIPVLEISDDIKVEPSHIYVIPSNKMLIANDGVLELSVRPEPDRNNRNLPIDLFFASLAAVHQSHSIGVVLSGTASDGTLGLKAIKDQGGLTFAQDDASATYNGMPQSAVQAGVVDFILPPEEIPKKIASLSRQFFKGESDEQDVPQQEEEVFKQILLLLRVRRGMDFTYYKETTIRRRILRRMALNKSELPSEYLKYLRSEKKEQDILFQDLLIPVTSFFRDGNVFNTLCDEVFPNITKSNLSEPLRIWVAGCSTGEEAYSMAICLKEYLGNKQDKVQIFASDLSEPAVAKARAGIYSKSEVEAVSPQRLTEFFTKHNGNYQVNKEIRDMCVFAVHNFLKDPPFGKIDFISCRNVLIYMEPYLQKKALSKFHYALNSGGFLLLGKSETTSSVPDLFSLTNGKRAKTDKLYIRKDAPVRFMHVVTPRSEQNFSDKNVMGKTENTQHDFQKSADDLMLAKYTPPGAVVNEALDVVHFRGNTGAYLELSPGKPSLNILKLAKSGLGFELRNIVHKAKKEKQAVKKENVPVEINGKVQLITIEAVQLQNTLEPYYVILFHDSKTLPEQTEPSRQKTRKKTTIDKNDSQDQQIKQLQQELAQSREDMRSISEDQEASNEELQSTNEELQSANEELQSLNEELETSKEELQSTVEELTVLSQELQSLNEQVTESRDYAEAIVETTSQPLLILDKKLRIKSANISFHKAFLTNETETEGKLIYELANRQWDNPQLRVLLEKILPEKENFEGYEVELEFSDLGTRKLVFNGRQMKTEKGAEKLILLAFEDVTQARKASIKIKESEERFHHLIYSSPSAIGILKGEDLVITIANNAIIEIWGKGNEIMGKKYFEALPELAEQGYDEVFSEVYKTGKPFNAIETPVSILQNGKIQLKYYNFLLFAQRDETNTIDGIGIIATEVTPQALLNKKIQESEENFRQLAELMPDKVSSADADGNIIYYNRSWLDYTGFTFEELKDWGWNKIIHPADVDELTKRWAHSIQTGDNFAMEVRLLNKDGVYRWHLTRSVAVKNEQGKISRWIAATTEVQEQKEISEQLEQEVKSRTIELRQTNENLKQKISELDKMNKELESFTYVSSHDLQEPLRKIQTFATHILQKENENLSDKGKDYFRRIQVASKRMQTLLEDLLKFSRASTGERVFENTDLKKIIQQVKLDFKEEIQEKHAVIELGELCQIKVIVYQFNQLIANLIGNALKFSRDEISPHIFIESKIISGSEVNDKRLVADKEYCHIQLSDNGIGFEQQYSDRIFEVFQRLHGKDAYPGTGIGLAIVRKIVENHDGIINVSSEPNIGTTFNIYIPDRA